MSNIRQVLRAHIGVLGLASGAIAGTSAFFLLPINLSTSTSLWGALAGVMAVAFLYLFFARHTIWGQFLVFAILASGTFYHYLNVHTAVLLKNRPDITELQAAKWVTGQISEMRTTNNRTRVTLENVTVYGPDAETLRKLRVSFAASRAEALNLMLGEGLAAQVVWQPPRAPAFPGDYDGRRRMFFAEIDAVGYVRGEMYRTELGTQQRFKNELDRFRMQLADDIQHYTRPLGAAFLTGIRHDLSAQTQEHFRESGLAHLLAISGLHVGMVAGIFYFGVRWLSTFYARLNYFMPMRAVGAVGGLAAAGAYAILAGGTVPTIRAFIMVGLVFLAVLLARPHTAIRLWAVAVLFILSMWPDKIVSPSFQMSFAATLGLIFWSLQQAPDADLPGYLRKRKSYLGSLWHVGLIAGLSTMPFAAWHFGMVTISGFFLNLVAIPLMGFWILPAGLLGLLALPFGLAAPPLAFMDYGLALLERIAALGSTDGALGQFLGGLYVSGDAWHWLALLALMGLSAVFMHKKYVLLASLCGIGLLATLFPYRAPGEIVVLDEGQNILVCESRSCGVYLAPGATDRATSWFLDILELKRTKLTMDCDGLLCVATHRGQKILLSAPPVPAEDLRWAQITLPPTTKETAYYKHGQWHIYKPASFRPWHRFPK